LACLEIAANPGYAVWRMNGEWHDRIVSNPTVLRGKPCIAGTRIPVALILGYVAAGRLVDDVVREFPDLAPADVAACLQYARDLADFEAVATA
jgi:uncharacterized protein (DUF433 family)